MSEKNTDSRKPAATKPEPTAAESKPKAAAAPSNPNVAVISLSVLAVLLAASLMAMVYWQWQQMQANTLKQASNVQVQIDALKQQLQHSAQQQFNEVEHALKEHQRQQKMLGERISKISETLHSQSEDDNAWLIGEVKYLLQLAHYHLVYANNDETVMRLLEVVDKRLLQLDNPQATVLRQKLQTYLTALKAAPAPDIAGLLAKLDGLIKQSPALRLQGPVKPPHASNATDASETEAASPSGWRGHFQHTLHALGQLVVIRRHDEMIKPLMTPAQHRAVLMHLQAQLMHAQWAVLNVDDAVYQASLTNAQAALNQYFDVLAPETKAFVSGIRALQAQKLVRERPDFNALLQAFSLLNEAKRAVSTPPPAPQTQ